MNGFTRMTACLLILLISPAVSAHTLFIKPDAFYLPQSQTEAIPLLNGTFFQSQNKVNTSRMTGAAIVTPSGARLVLQESRWRYNGNTTMLDTQFDEPGNYVIGVGTKVRKINVTAETFNKYLINEGLADDAEQRQRLQEQDVRASERYAKFAKAIVQVGDKQTENYAEVLGHRVEIVPLVNPYAIKSGQRFRARILKDGKPLANELVFASHEGFREKNAEGRYKELATLRSDENGIIEWDLTAPGRWYIRFIHLTRLGDAEYWYSNLLIWLGVEERRIPYESLWATLTFEVR
jgi:uncharacterized GH25 family protein